MLARGGIQRGPGTAYGGGGGHVGGGEEGGGGDIISVVGLEELRRGQGGIIGEAECENVRG